MQPSGSPALEMAPISALTITRLEFMASLPPRKITALPDLRQSAAVSAVTLGRDS